MRRTLFFLSIVLAWYIASRIFPQFSDPLTLFPLVLTVGILGNFIFVSREAAIQLSLRRMGVAGEGQIIKRRSQGGRGGPTRWVTYEFTEFATGQSYRHEEMVADKHYFQWKIGDTIPIIVLPHNPRISRLTMDNLRLVTIFGSGAISLVFPVYFFGLNSVFAVLLLCMVILGVNLLWINLRGK